MIFHFKQFSVNQAGCAMKVNTDGVLLGALCAAKNPQNILDVGTGTGVIAIMMAQRYPDALIDAVEIDNSAATTADQNFRDSPFRDRCTCYPLSFEGFFHEYSDRKYDLIVSNPPFFINSLKSAEKRKEIARHVTGDFFQDLLVSARKLLNPGGNLSLILPCDTAEVITAMASEQGLYLQHEIRVASFPDSAPHRKILVLSHVSTETTHQDFVIYSGQGTYSEQYRSLLADFLTIF
jgi:tRNA1Val (adenine37-N6)-methyltransferase